MNGDVSIVTNENQIDVKYGLFNLREEREQAKTSWKYILSDMEDIKKSYFRLGFHLHEFRKCEYYRDFGYLTFEEFCVNNLDIDKGAVSRCINVFLMTTAYGEEKYNAGCKTIGCAYEMSDRYRDYSYSQLCEMLPLNDEQRKLVTPAMTVREIRDLKKQNKVATSQPKEEIEPEEPKLFTYEELETEEFLTEMFSRIKEVLEYLTLDVYEFERHGKQLSFKDIDGNQLSILYRVSKKKEG